MTPRRGTTIPVAVAAFVAGAVTAVFVMVTVADRAAADHDLGRSKLAPAPAASPVETVALAHDDSDSIADLRARHLLVPVDGVDPTTLRSSFRDARTAGRAHEAMDILAPRHTAVRAVAEGTIAKLFRSDAGGNTIYEFDEHSQYAFYYAHLERYAPGLREQDRVERGAVIGFVGTSGNAPPDTPHLHFAIFRLGPERRWWQGEPIDPFEVWRR